jgi:hypothetical protein
VKQQPLFLTTLALTITMGLTTSEPAFNNGVSSPHTRSDSYRIKRTVLGAGSTFHTIILINYIGFACFNHKNLVRADLNAHAAANAFILV